MTTLLLLLAPVSTAQPPRAAAVAEVAPAPNPVPDAAQLAAWVADLTSAEPNKAGLAYQALLKAGPRARGAVPALVKLLGAKEIRPYEVAEILGAVGPDAKEAIPALLGLCKPQPFGFMVDAAAVAVARIDGPKPEATRGLLLSSGKGIPILLVSSRYLTEFAPKVVPQVVELCGDKDAVVRQKAAAVLESLEHRVYPPGYTGKAGVPLLEVAADGAKDVPATLEKLLADPDAGVRMAAARAISRVFPKLAGKTIPVVIAVMSDEKHAATVAAEHYYWAPEIFRPVPGQAAAALIPLFDSGKEAVRWWAVNTLGALPVTGELVTTLKDGKTARTREAAAICLGSHYFALATAAPAIEAALADREFVVRFAAAKSLIDLSGRKGTAVDGAVPVLIEGIKQTDETPRLEASRYLVKVGPGAKAAVPELKRLLGDKSPAVALEAALALATVAPADAAEAVPVLIEGVKAAEHQTATRAARALAPLGDVAKSAVPELVKRFDPKTFAGLRLAAAEAVGRLDPDQGEKAGEVLLAIIKEFKGGTFRTDAVKALARIGLPAKSAAPALATLLKEYETRSGYFPVEVAFALVSVDPGNAAGLDWFRKHLAENDGGAFDVIDRIPELGVKAKPLIPELVTLLKAKTPYHREHAVEALAAIGSEAKAALPQLKEVAANDPKPAIRGLAAAAVKKIEGK